MKNILLWLIAGLCSGCASSPPVYQLGATGSTAKFKFETSSFGAAHIYDDGASCKGISPIKTGDWIIVKADEPLTFVAHGGSNVNVFDYRFCRANVTFSPKKNGIYLAKFLFGDKSCRVAVFEVQTDDVQHPVESYLRKYDAPFFQSGSWCGERIQG